MPASVSEAMGNSSDENYFSELNWDGQHIKAWIE